MSHRLKPTEVTSMLLSLDAKFQWEPSKNRIVRFDEFANELAAKFAVVAWDEDAKIANQSKVELFTLCSGARLREFINSTISKEPDIIFGDLVIRVRKMLMKCTPPLVQLAKVIANHQGPCESFETFFNSVNEDAKSICWESLNSHNIKNVLIATILASNSTNPYVKGHCLSVRDVSSIKLEDIKSTALEYEAKNPLPSSFPSSGLFAHPKPHRSLFGNSMTNQAHTGNQPLFGSSQSSGACQAPVQNGGSSSGFSFGAPANNPKSFEEEQSSGMFASAPNTPFGTSNRNIFMSNRAPQQDVPPSSSTTELVTVIEEPPIKRQRSESSDK